MGKSRVGKVFLRGRSELLLAPAEGIRTPQRLRQATPKTKKRRRNMVEQSLVLWQWVRAVAMIRREKDVELIAGLRHL